jgi:calcium binding protein 39
MVAGYLQTNFDAFFSKYNSMLVQSESYVTKRQSIKLLGEILLDRANYNVMTQYVDSGEHLKIIMKLLRDDRKMINYEGFHVFKVSQIMWSQNMHTKFCRSSSQTLINRSPCNGY